MAKTPIVKIRFDKTHFYLGAFPQSMDDLAQQTKSKLSSRNLIDKSTELKYRYCDPWNDMVEIENNLDVLTMQTQAEHKPLVLIEVSKVEEPKKSSYSYDLKGFVSFFKELAPELTSQFKFIMEEGDQIPCEECLGKGTITRGGKKLTCPNCSGCGARPLSGFWELLLSVIDYRLNQRIFDQVEKYFGGWNQSQPKSSPKNSPALPLLVKDVSIGQSAMAQVEAKTVFEVLSERQSKVPHLTSDKLQSLSIEGYKARQSLGGKKLEKPCSISQADDSEPEVVVSRQSPQMGKPALAQIGSLSIISNPLLTNSSTLTNSGLWPAAQAKVTVSASPKPAFNLQGESRIRSLTGKLQGFSEVEADKILGVPLMKSEIELGTTRKDIRFEWVGGSKEITIDPHKPKVRLAIKNTSDFEWGTWLEFILKSENIRKSVPLEQPVQPGETVETELEDLEGLGEETLVVQLKGIDEKTYTKHYSSERLELIIKTAK